MSAFWIPLLALPLIAGEAETIVLRPDEGVTLEKIWTTRHVLRAIHMNRALGEESRAYRMRSDGISSEEVLGATDEYLEVGTARPTRLRRVFHKGRRTSQIFDTKGGGGPKIRQKATLRGTSVVLTWAEEEQDYGMYYDAEELEERLLGELRTDLDLAFALPPGPVAPGDTWPLAPEVLIDLFGRGGTFPFEEVTGKDDFLVRALDSGVGGGLEQAFGEFTDGTAEVEFREVRESDAGRLAVLELRCDVRYAKDRTEYVQANTIRQETREGIEYLDAFLKLEIEGQAEILWNLDLRHPVSLAFLGQETAYARITHRAPSDDEGVERSQDVTMQGPLEIQATFTRQP